MKAENIAGDQKENAIESIELVHSGEDYFARLERIINEAQFEIHLQTYIFDDDDTGKKIAECLKKAANRKVNIYILLDAFGSKSLSRKFINDLKDHGINFRFFSANFFLMSRRLHHKVIVADGNVALIGGINIADKYRGTKTQSAWLDYAIEMKGKIAEPIQKICENIYIKKKRRIRKQTIFNWGNDTVSILINDWLRRKNEISNAYLKSIGNAKEEVIIVGSYFLPGRRLISKLKRASRRGVKVKLILSGLSDVPLVKRATSYLYTSLLDNNIELYEWGESVLHGKVAVIDNDWSTVGSFNLNHLSSYGSLEMNVAVRSTKFTAAFKSHLNEVLGQCEEIIADAFKTNNPLLSRIANWFSYSIVRFILLTITYVHHKRFSKHYTE